MFSDVGRWTVVLWCFVCAVAGSAADCAEGVCTPSTADPFTWARHPDRVEDVKAYLALEDESTQEVLHRLGDTVASLRHDMDRWNRQYAVYQTSFNGGASWDGNLLRDRQQNVVLNASTFCRPDQSVQMGVGAVALAGGTVALLLDCTGGERYDLFVGPPAAIVKVDSDCFDTMSLSPDGRSLVYTRMTNLIGALGSHALALRVRADGTTTAPQRLPGVDDAAVDYAVFNLSPTHFFVLQSRSTWNEVYVGSYHDFSLVRVAPPGATRDVFTAVTDTFCESPSYFAASVHGGIARVDSAGQMSPAYAAVADARIDGVWSCGCNHHPIARLRNYTDASTRLVQFTSETTWRTLRTSDNLRSAGEFWAGYQVATIIRTADSQDLPMWELSGVVPPVACTVSCEAGHASLTCDERPSEPFAVERGAVEGVPYYLVRPPGETVGYIFEAYGAYGSTMRADFAAYRLAMVARNYTWVRMNPRGSGVSGTSWFEGRGAMKANTFADIASVIRSFRSADPAQPTVLHGWSAGGLAATATGLLYPDLVDVVWGEAPFVDVSCAMRDPEDMTSSYEVGEWSDTCTAPFDPMRLVAGADVHTAPLMYLETSYEDIRVPCSQVARFGLMARAHTSLRHLLIRTRHGSHAAGQPVVARAESLATVLYLINQTKALSHTLVPAATIDVAAIVAVTALLFLCVGACTWLALMERSRRRALADDGIPLVRDEGGEGSSA